MNHSGLQKGLKERHMAMIAIAGVIGAGLFVGSGAVIHSTGPGAIRTKCFSFSSTLPERSPCSSIWPSPSRSSACGKNSNAKTAIH